MVGAVSAEVGAATSEVASGGSLWIIYALVVFYALCYQLQRPIEPFLVDKLVKGGPTEAAIAFGRVESFFSVAQGVGSLMMGYMLDRFGVRIGLIVNFVACAMQYGLLSMCDSLSMLFLSKAPGMLMGGFLCAQTAVARVTQDGPDRVAALGRLTTAYTVGGVVGPYIGGYLGSSGDYFLGSRLATMGSLVAAALVLLLPSHLDTQAKQAAKRPAVQPASSSSSSCSSSTPDSWLPRAMLVLQVTGFSLAVKVATGIANNMARSAQPLILKNDLGFDEGMMGKVMSGNFAFGGLSNGCLLAPLTAALGGDTRVVVRNCVAIMGVVYMLEAALFAPGLALMRSGSMLSGGTYIGIALFLSLFQFSLSTSITAGTQSMVPKDMLGTLMGIEHSIFAVAGMVGPLVGTYVFRTSGISGLALACSSLFLGILLIWTAMVPTGATSSTARSKKSE
mmetsp:Transcript_56477/g.93339  ORF Transcript_56477/g.93339 Transcript_56477/m.93339 type:complete len:450 (-) Transcript_56477:261-1610(-)|eukprot:CAMPEP_0119316354 /NCGR_PEP_ID=MMETSP1333-20130426/39428_1 /TAXON_ID=418940 /ORGANISM="Scyphosphaera apsteinii, Strain RCC1455" /LENGTH=449 /DNA_ID=CAMNT_0007321975 /DNA_START=88 /DNA_END=1437 /DNA_ORIENTATION=-